MGAFVTSRVLAARHQVSRVFTPFLLGWATFGCSDGVSDHNTTAQVDTLASGLVQLTNTGEPVWTPATAWRLDEDLRLGRVQDQPSAQFSRIAAVLSDSLGMIYVLDLFAQEIRVFHPGGALSHVIGGKGEGPGEFLAASDITFGPGDTLWVVDPRTRRYSAFHRDGTFVGSHPRPIDRYGGEGEFMPDGRYIDWDLGFPEERPGIIAGRRVILQPIRFSGGFQDGDSLPSLEYTREMMANGTRPQPFFNSDLIVSLDRTGNIWFAHNREYRIYRRSVTGDTTLVFTLPAEPVPLGEAELQYVRSRMASQPTLVSVYVNALPETKPIIHGILTDGSGHIMVFPEVTGTAGIGFVDIFRETGHFLGRLPLPTSISLLGPQQFVAHATSDYLLIVVTDEFDVPYVSRLRIDKR